MLYLSPYSNSSSLWYRENLYLADCYFQGWVHDRSNDVRDEVPGERVVAPLDCIMLNKKKSIAHKKNCM